MRRVEFRTPCVMTETRRECVNARRQVANTLLLKPGTHARLAIWLRLSGNALASINVVALRRTRLVPGWVTVCGRVNHLGM